MENFDRNMNAAQDSSKLISSSSNVLNINQCDDMSSHESCLNIYVSDKMNNQDSTINKENLDYLSTMLNSSVNIEFLTSNNNEKEDDWKNNWILKEAKAIFTTSVEMLIPAPKDDIHVSIDGKIMDEIISDISETGSDFEDTQHNIDTVHDKILIDDNEKIHISHEIDNTLLQLDKSQHDFQNNNMSLENESEINKNISESENSEKQINKILHQTLNGSFEEPIIEPPERFNDENSYFDLMIQSIGNSEIKANINNTVNLEQINSKTIIQYITREGVEESIKHEKITINNEEIQKDSQQNAQKSNESDNVSVNQADTIVETSKFCSGRENEYDKESYVAVQNNNKSVKIDLITEILMESVNETIEQSSCDTDSKTTRNDNEVLKVINVINENTPDSSTKTDANVISTESEIHETLTTNEQIEENKVCSNETIIDRNETEILNDDLNTLRIELVDGDRNSISKLKENEKSENSNHNYQSVTSTLATETNNDVQVDKNQCRQSEKDSEIEVVINQNFEINENDKEDHVDKSTCNSVLLNDQVDAVSIVTDQKDSEPAEKCMEITTQIVENIIEQGSDESSTSETKQVDDKTSTEQNSTFESIVDEKVENSHETDNTVREDKSVTDNVQPLIVTPEIENNQDRHETENEAEESQTKESKADSRETVDVSQNVGIIQNDNTDSIKATEESLQTIELSTDDQADTSTCNSVSINDQVDAVSIVTDQKDSEPAGKCMEITTEIVESIIEQRSDESSTSETKQVDYKIFTEQNSTFESIVDEKVENSHENDNTIRENQSVTDNVQPLIVTPEIENNQDRHETENEVEESQTKESKADSEETVDVSQNVDINQNDNTDSIKATEESPQSIKPSTDDQGDTSTCNSVLLSDQVDAVSTVTDQKDSEPAEKCMEITTEIVENIIEQRSDESSTSETKQVDDKISTEQNSTFESIVDEKLENSSETENTVREDQSVTDNVQPLIVTPEIENNQDRHETENEVEESQTKESKADSEETVDVSQNVDIIQNDNTDSIKATEESLQTIEPTTDDQADTSTCNSVLLSDQVDAVSTVTDQKDSEPAEKCMEITTEIVESIIEQRSDESSTSETKQVDDKISTEQNRTFESIVDEKLENSSETENTVREDKSVTDNVQPLIVTPEIENNQDRHETENEVEESQTKESKADSKETVDVSQNVDIIQNDNIDSIKATEESPISIKPSTDDQGDTSTCNSVLLSEQVDAISTVTDQKDSEPAEKCMEITTEIVESIIEQRSDESSTSETKQVDDKISTEQNSTFESIVDEQLENSSETENTVREDQSVTDNVQPLIVTPEIENNQDRHETENEVEESQTKESKADSEETVDVSQNVDIIQNDNTDSIKATEESPQSTKPSTDDQGDTSTCNSVLLSEQVDAVSTVTDQKDSEPAEKCMEITTEIVENIIEQRSDESRTSETKQVDDKISTEQNSTFESIVDEKLENSHENDNTIREDKSVTDNVQPLIVTPEIENNQDRHETENEVEESQTKESKADSEETVDVSQNVDIIQNDNTDSIKATEESLQTIEPTTDDQADTSTCNSVLLSDQVDAVSTVTDQKDSEPAEKCMEITTEIVESIIEQRSDESRTSETKQVDDKISTEQNSTFESIVDEKVENSHENDNTIRENQSVTDNVQPLIVTPEIENNQDRHETENEVEESQTKESKADSKETVDVSQNVDIIQNDNTDSIKATEESPQSTKPSTDDQGDTSTCNSVLLSEQVDAISTVTDQKDSEPAEKCMEITTEIVESIIEQRSDESRTSETKQVDDKISTEQNSTFESIVDEKVEISHENDNTIRENQSVTDNVQPLIVTPEIENNQDRHETENEVEESQTKESKADSKETVDVSQNVDIIQNDNTDSIKATEESPQSTKPSTDDQGDTSTCNSVLLSEQVDAISTVTDQKDSEPAEKCMEITTEIVESIIEQRSDESSTSETKQVDDKISTEQNSTFESIVDEKLENSSETENTVREDQSVTDNVQPLIVTPEIENNQDRHETENEVEESQTKESKADSEETVDVSQNVDIIQNNNTDSIKATEESPISIKPSTDDQGDTSTCNIVLLSEQVDAVSTVTDQKDSEPAEKCMEITTEIVENIIEQRSDESRTSETKQVDDKISTEQNSTFESIVDDKLENSHENDNTIREDKSVTDNVQPLIVTPEIENNQDRHETENEVEESQTKESKADSKETVDVSQNVDIIQNDNTDSIKATEESPQSIKPSTDDQGDTSICNSVLLSEQVDAISTVTDQKDSEPAEKCMEITTEIVENIIEQRSDESSTSETKQVDDKISTEQNSTFESIVDEKLENSHENDNTIREDKSVTDNVQPLIVTPEIENNQDRHETENEVEESQTKESKADSEETVDVSQNVDIIQNDNTDSIKATEESLQTIEPTTDDQADTSTCNSVLLSDQVDAVSTVTDQKDSEPAEKCMEITTEIVESIIEQRSDESSTSETKQVDYKISTEQNSTFESIVDEKVENSHENDNTIRENQSVTDNVQPLIVTPEIENNQDRHETENEVEESQTKESKADSEETVDVSQNVDIIQNDNTDSIKATEESPQSIKPSTDDQGDTSTCNTVLLSDQVDAVSTVTDQKDSEPAEKCMEITTEIVESIIEQRSDESRTSETKQVDDKISTEQNSTFESIVDEKLENSSETENRVREDQIVTDNVQPLIVTPEIENNQDRHETENEVEESQTKESKADSEETVDVSQNVDIIQNDNTDSIKATEEYPISIKPSTDDQGDTSTCNSVLLSEQVDAISTVTDQKDSEPAEKCMEITTEIVENIIEQRSDESSTSETKQVDDKISTEQNSTFESIVDEKLENSSETENTVREDKSVTDNVQPLIVTPEIENNQDRHETENEVEESQTKESKADSEETVDVSQNVDINQNDNTDSIKATEESLQTIEPTTDDQADTSTCNSVLLSDQVDAVSTVTDQKDSEPVEKCMEITTEIVENIIEQRSDESRTSETKQVDDKISTEQNSTFESIVDEKIENSHETDNTIRENQSVTDNVQRLIVTPEIENNQDRHETENEVEESQTKESKADSKETVDVSQNVDIIQNNSTDSIKATEEAPQTVETSTEDQPDTSTCNIVSNNDQVDINSFVTERKDISSVEQSSRVTKENVVDIIEQKKPTIKTQSCYVINDKLSHNYDIHMISESVSNEKCGQLDCTNSESVIREEQSNERGENFCDENKNEKSNICIEDSSSIIVNKNFENNNSQRADSSTPSDDNDVIRIYDLNKQKKIIIRQDSTEKITKNTDSKSKSISSKAHPSILSVTTKLQSRKIVTPAALKFLQPKRKIFEPEQIMSDLEGTSSPVFEKRDIMPTTTSSVISKTPEKIVIEPEVIPALPSVKALAKAFLLTSAKCSLKHPEKLKVKNDEENVSNDKRAKPSPDSYSPPYQQMKYNPIETWLNHDENNVTDISETTSAVIFCNENDNDQENNNNVPADRPISPVLGVGKLKTNIAFFENLKKN